MVFSLIIGSIKKINLSLTETYNGRLLFILTKFEIIFNVNQLIGSY